MKNRFLLTGIILVLLIISVSASNFTYVEWNTSQLSSYSWNLSGGPGGNGGIGPSGGGGGD